MIISFAFGLIASLLVLANSRSLRKKVVFLVAIILAAGIAALGIYFILHSSKEMDKNQLFPMFSPLAALILLFITRFIYKKVNNLEIIIHMQGLFPVKQDERYVTRREKNITLILLLLSVLIPYLTLILVL